jgi:hypothetical protein
MAAVCFVSIAAANMAQLELQAAVKVYLGWWQGV